MNMEKAMSRFITRLLSHATLFLAGLLIIGAVDTVHAQIAVSKDLCGPIGGGGAAGCVTANGISVVPPNTLVSYQITLINQTTLGQTQIVDLQETLPQGFVLGSMICSNNGATPLPPTGGPWPSPIFFNAVTVPPGTTTCTITGTFNYLPATANNANNTVTAYAPTDHNNPISNTGQVNAAVGPPATIPSNVSVLKTAVVNLLGNGTATVHYTITVSNNGPNDVYGLQLQDRVRLPTTSIPLTATYAGSSTCTVVALPGGPGTSDCFGPVPGATVTVPSTTPVDFVAWGYPLGSTGVLKAHDSIVIEFDVVINVPSNIACQRDVNGNWLINEAHIGFTIPGATTMTFESAPGDNTSEVPVQITLSTDVAPVDQNCGQPALQITKTRLTVQPIIGFAWGSNITYEITLHNASNAAIMGIQLIDAAHTLGDFVSGGVGTPAFDAEVYGIACPSSICSGTVPLPAFLPPGPQQVAGYLNPSWMLGTNVVPTLGPGNTVSFQVQIQYTRPKCDSYPDVTQKPVLNFVRAKYFDPTLGGYITLQSAPAIALFKAPLPCNFKVTKQVTDGSTKILFGQNVHYTVTYQNLDAQPVTIGTMIDALRIVQPNTPYASPLTVHFDYNCTTTTGVTGFSAVGGAAPFTFPFTVYPPQTVQVFHTSLPQQGFRIIQNTVPVLFPGNSSVTCDVRISVDPPLGATQCARLGELENAAIMDTSEFYNPNLPWPTGTNPGFAAKVSLPLPKCFDLVVNKDVNPIWTTQNGGPLNYHLIISNLGDPIVPTDQVSLTDAFSYGAASPPSNSCLDNNGTSVSLNAPNCNFAWSSPSTQNIQTLASHWSAYPAFSLSGPYPAPYPALPGQVCNNAAATLIGLNPQDWYPRDLSTWSTQRCVPIFDARPLVITKTVTVTAPATTPPATIFNVSVACSYIVNGVQYGPSTTITFNSSTLSPVTVSPIPVGSTCTITEQPLPPPVAMPSCPSGLAVWGPVTYPNTQSVTIGTTAPNTLEVHNTLACVALDLGITKSGPSPIGGGLQSFTLAVTNVGAPLTRTNVIKVSDIATGMPGVVVGAVATPSSAWNCAPPAANNVNCTYVGNGVIATGQLLGTITIIYNVYAAGPFVNCATVALTPASGLLDSYLPNNMACINVGMASNMAALTVSKTTTNLSPITMPNPQFPVTVNCQPGGPVANLSLTANGGALLVPNIPVGSNCTITETPPAMVAPTPAYCQWVTTLIWDGVAHPNGSQFMNVQIVQPVPGNIEVHNDFVCNPPPPACAAPPSGMVAWWPLNETSGMIVTDIIGGHNGTPYLGPIGGPVGSLTNGPAPGTAATNLTMPAMVGGSLYFSIHKFVRVPNAPDLNFGAGDFTIDAWVYPTLLTYDGVSGPTVVQFIVDKLQLVAGSNTGGIGYRLFILDGQLHFVLADGFTVVNLQAPIASGQWHHVAAVREGNTVKIYIGGTLVSTSPSAVNSISNNANLLIGTFVNSSSNTIFGLTTSNWPGDIAIDELEIFNRALQPPEIQSIVKAGSAGKCPCTPPPSGMAHWWPFDEPSGSTAQGLVGGINGTTQPGSLGASGSPTSVAGMVGKAFGFNGSTALVKVTDPGTLSFGNPTDNFSIDAWIKVLPGDKLGILPIVDKRLDQGGKISGYAFFLLNGLLGFQLGDGSVANNICGPATSPTTSCTNYISGVDVGDGSWHHVAATVQRTGATPLVTLYVDGAVIFTATARINASNNADLLIGSGYPILIDKPYFRGAIDELEIFNRVLLPSEIQSIVNAGSAGKCKAMPVPTGPTPILGVGGACFPLQQPPGFPPVVSHDPTSARPLGEVIYLQVNSYNWLFELGAFAAPVDIYLLLQQPNNLPVLFLGYPPLVVSPTVVPFSPPTLGPVSNNPLFTVPYSAIPLGTYFGHVFVVPAGTNVGTFSLATSPYYHWCFQRTFESKGPTLKMP